MRHLEVVEGQNLVADDLAGLVALARDEQTVAGTELGDSAFDRLAAVADFLEREREGVATDQMFLDRRTPFKKGD